MNLFKKIVNTVAFSALLGIGYVGSAMAACPGEIHCFNGMSPAVIQAEPIEVATCPGGGNCLNGMSPNATDTIYVERAILAVS